MDEALNNNHFHAQWLEAYIQTHVYPTQYVYMFYPYVQNEVFVKWQL